MNKKTTPKKLDPPSEEKREKERQDRMKPAKHLEGNVARIVERGRQMGF